MFHQGQPARQLFLLEWGQIKVHRVAPDGHEILLRFMTSGELFGYNALRDASKYTVSSSAVHDSRAAVWEGNLIRELLYSYPRLALNTCGILVRGLSEFEERYHRLVTKPVEQRIAKALAELTTRIGARVGNATVVSIRHRDLAELAGTSLYSVSRVFGDWQRRGILIKRGSRIVVPDIATLVTLAETA